MPPPRKRPCLCGTSGLRAPGLFAPAAMVALSALAVEGCSTGVAGMLERVFLFVAICAIVMITTLFGNLLSLILRMPSRRWGIAGIALGVLLLLVGTGLVIQAGFRPGDKWRSPLPLLPAGAVYCLLGWINLRASRKGREAGSTEIHVP
ncbi:MAG: hypothetical protein R3B70_26825 [Polyangiaceae bacterium]